MAAHAGGAPPERPTLAQYVERAGGSHVIRRILIANNGIGAVKCIRSIRFWAYETFGNEREVRPARGQREGTSCGLRDGRARRAATFRACTLAATRAAPPRLHAPRSPQPPPPAPPKPFPSPRCRCSSP
jgi:hypothetical protein